MNFWQTANPAAILHVKHNRYQPVGTACKITAWIQADVDVIISLLLFQPYQLQFKSMQCPLFVVQGILQGVDTVLFGIKRRTGVSPCVFNPALLIFDPLPDRLDPVIGFSYMEISQFPDRVDISLKIHSNTVKLSC